MFQFPLYIFPVLFLSQAASVDAFDDDKRLVEIIDDLPSDSQYENPKETVIESAIEKFENLAGTFSRKSADGILPLENTDLLYENMIGILHDIIETVKNSNNAYIFLKNKGLDRIVAPNILDIDDELKTNLMILLKVLLEVAPTTTTSVIPTSIIDGLLEIFEKDNLALKAHALDVMYAWLPENPRVQTRVMKLKGLEPFYQQITKLDSAVIKNLLDLFNKIINEHLKIRNDIKRNKIDSEIARIYQRIGLIERLSTPLVCNGLLNIFATSWTYNTKDNSLMITVLDLMKNVKQFCLKKFQGQTKAIELFDALLEYIRDSKNNQYFEANGVNITEMVGIIEDYIKNVKYSPKDEF